MMRRDSSILLCLMISFFSITGIFASKITSKKQDASSARSPKPFVFEPERIPKLDVEGVGGQHSETSRSASLSAFLFSTLSALATRKDRVFPDLLPDDPLCGSMNNNTEAFREFAALFLEQRKDSTVTTPFSFLHSIPAWPSPFDEEFENSEEEDKAEEAIEGRQEDFALPDELVESLYDGKGPLKFSHLYASNYSPSAKLPLRKDFYEFSSELASLSSEAWGKWFSWLFTDPASDSNSINRREKGSVAVKSFQMYKIPYYLPAFRSDSGTWNVKTIAFMESFGLDLLLLKYPLLEDSSIQDMDDLVCLMLLHVLTNLPPAEESLKVKKFLKILKLVADGAIPDNLPVLISRCLNKNHLYTLEAAYQSRAISSDGDLLHSILSLESISLLEQFILHPSTSASDGSNLYSGTSLAHHLLSQKNWAILLKALVYCDTRGAAIGWDMVDTEGFTPFGRLWMTLAEASEPLTMENSPLWEDLIGVYTTAVILGLGISPRLHSSGMDALDAAMTDDVVGRSNLKLFHRHLFAIGKSTTGSECSLLPKYLERSFSNDRLVLFRMILGSFRFCDLGETVVVGPILEKILRSLFDRAIQLRPLKSVQSAGSMSLRRTSSDSTSSGFFSKRFFSKSVDSAPSPVSRPPEAKVHKQHQSMATMDASDVLDFARYILETLQAINGNEDISALINGWKQELAGLSGVHDA